MHTEKMRHGFSVLRESRVDELDAVLYHMRHKRTGLELVWLKREEENKTFGIAFQTIPEDDTGVFHILEHSVLCGSERYPVKEPFVELVKHSMSTFLNAMTFPDKTFYPISSRNDKDFFNLMRVYLDAVFHPLIRSRPEIFYQEGWHYELDPEGKPSYKGVVFNEMKGAYADADRLAARAVCQALFPNTSYRFESGGDPACIPDLTYERFLSCHHKCYSPSNGYVFLDGGVDIETALAILDGDYLCQMERGQRLAPPAMQAPVKSGARHVEFEIPVGEGRQKRCRIVWGSVIGAYDQLEKITAMQVLATVLCGDNQAPLSQAVLSRGLAESVTMQVVDDVAQPWVQLEARNLDKEDQEQVERIIYGELDRLSREGVERQRLESAMANLEFQMRERDYGAYPQGLMFGFSVLSSWMRGGDPAANLEVGDLFVRLREKMAQGYFEQLIQQIFLEAPHSCKIVLTPSHAAGETRRKAEAERLSRESAGWSEEDRQALWERQKALERWQSSADAPEQLGTLPHLELSDLSEEPVALPTQIGRAGSVPLLRHDMAAGGILYGNLYFDVSGCSAEELSCLSFLCRLLGKVGTEDHTAEEIGNQKRLLCGNMSFFLSAYETFGQPENYKVALCASFSVLEHNLDKAVALMTELLTCSRFGREQEIRDVLKQNRMQMFQGIVMSGHLIALGRLAAQTSAAAVVRESTGGFDYYRWLKEQEERWDWPRLQAQLTELYRRVICRDGLTVSVTGLPGQNVERVVERLAQRLPVRAETAAPVAHVRPWEVRQEGIEIPSDVCFAAMGGSLMRAGSTYSGVWQLASRVVGLNYLWNAIRVQGGAYGTGLVVQDSGVASCYSYRDPDGSRSLGCYRGAADFLRQFCAGQPDLTGFMIGAVSDAEPLMTPRVKGMTADSYYWKKLDWAKRCQLRRELLSAKPTDLADLAAPLERLLEQGGVCVIGPRSQLEQCSLDDILSI